MSKTHQSTTYGTPADGRAVEQPVGATSEEVVVFDRSDLEGCIPSRFERQVEVSPQHVAISDRGHHITYEALNRAANRLAHAILADGRPATEPVTLLLEHGAPVIIGIIGVLKAGQPYVSMDPSFPPARRAYTLRDVRASLIVTNNANLHLASEHVGSHEVRVLNLDALDSGFPDHNPGVSISPDALTSILYTSGSTGQPKGVMRTHRQELHRVWVEVNDFGRQPQERQSMLYFCNFAASQVDVFGALLTGATLCPFNIRASAIHELAEWVQTERITRLHVPVTVFRRVSDHVGAAHRFPDLKFVVLQSGRLLTDELTQFRRHMSANCTFLHGFSSTETTLVTRLRIDPDTTFDGDVVPVGYPIHDLEVLIADEAGERVGYDEVGEIIVKGRYLSPGYWEKPDETRQVFRSDPEGGDRRLYRTGDLGRIRPDGCLELLGRKDFQVKVRGFRIELSEIELALRALPDIQDAAVVARRDGADGARNDQMRVTAYVVPSDAAALDVERVRTKLAETLPTYMIPAVFMQIDRLPLTPNGKLDRRALPVPGSAQLRSSDTFVPPRTALEFRLARIWCDVLGLNEVGVHDDFLALGGDSLLAAQTVSRVISKVGLELSVPLLLQSSTVAETVATIAEQHPGAEHHQGLEQLLADIEALSQEEAERLVAGEDAASRPEDDIE